MHRPKGAAHPRSRGENIGDSLAPINTEGSSPLTRGKPRDCGRRWHGRGLIPAHAGKTRYRPAREDSERLIPAHAGKTSRSPQTSVRVTAHPRSRGENFAALVADEPSFGSSPLTRGKRRRAASR